MPLTSPRKWLFLFQIAGSLHAHFLHRFVPRLNSLSHQSKLAFIHGRVAAAYPALLVKLVLVLNQLFLKQAALPLLLLIQSPLKSASQR